MFCLTEGQVKRYKWMFFDFTSWAFFTSLVSSSCFVFNILISTLCLSTKSRSCLSRALPSFVPRGPRALSLYFTSSHSSPMFLTRLYWAGGIPYLYFACPTKSFVWDLCTSQPLYWRSLKQLLRCIANCIAQAVSIENKRLQRSSLRFSVL